MLSSRLKAYAMHMSLRKSIQCSLHTVNVRHNTECSYLYSILRDVSMKYFNLFCFFFNFSMAKNIFKNKRTFCCYIPMYVNFIIHYYCFIIDAAFAG